MEPSLLQKVTLGTVQPSYKTGKHTKSLFIAIKNHEALETTEVSSNNGGIS